MDTNSSFLSKILSAVSGSSTANREEIDNSLQEINRSLSELILRSDQTNAILRQNSFMLNEQITIQRRSLTFLGKIYDKLDNIGSSGSSGFSIPDLFGAKRREGGLAPRARRGVARTVLGAAGAVAATGAATIGTAALIDRFTRKSEDETGNTLQGLVATSNLTPAIREARERGEKVTNLLELKARDIVFDARKLTFDVESLKINVKGQQQQGLSASSGGATIGASSTGGRGSTGGAGAGGGGGGGGTGEGAGITTPKDIPGTGGRYTQGNVPTPKFAGTGGETVTSQFKPGMDIKDDLAKARSFQPSSGFIGGMVGSKKTYTSAEMASLIRQVGGTPEEARILGAIGSAESSGRAGVLNPRGKDLSYGLWQINMRGSLGPERLKKYGLKSNEDLYNPLINAKIALSMVRANGGYSDWSTYTTGKFRQFLGGSTQGANNPVTLNAKNIKVKHTDLPSDIDYFGTSGGLVSSKAMKSDGKKVSTKSSGINLSEYSQLDYMSEAPMPPRRPKDLGKTESIPFPTPRPKDLDRVRGNMKSSSLSHQEYQTVRKVIQTDPHTESRKLFEQAAMMERNGENAAGMYFAADRRRQYELQHLKELSSYIKTERVLKRVEASKSSFPKIGPMPAARPGDLDRPVRMPEVLASMDERTREDKPQPVRGSDIGSPLVGGDERLKKVYSGPYQPGSPASKIYALSRGEAVPSPKSSGFWNWLKGIYTAPVDKSVDTPLTDPMGSVYSGYKSIPEPPKTSTDAIVPNIDMTYRNPSQSLVLPVEAQPPAPFTSRSDHNPAVMPGNKNKKRKSESGRRKKQDRDRKHFFDRSGVHYDPTPYRPTSEYA